MAIFKKSAVQGNFVLTNGVQVLFDADGFYETEDENECNQLGAVYEEVKAKLQPEEKAEEAPVAVAANVGAASSATLKALVK